MTLVQARQIYIESSRNCVNKNWKSLFNCRLSFKWICKNLARVLTEIFYMFILFRFFFMILNIFQGSSLFLNSLAHLPHMFCSFLSIVNNKLFRSNQTFTNESNSWYAQQCVVWQGLCQKNVNIIHSRLELMDPFVLLCNWRKIT